ncbi:LuxR C-terminal-related transcriptional regulator [Streptomyces sp. NPDC048508]|uniref:helix-turn-helix transcriptional regulator n=1 Tax=Streptomyces sp. NPDC048508 TaxID=3365561 RepID=UPI00371F2994
MDLLDKESIVLLRRLILDDAIIFLGTVSIESPASENVVALDMDEKTHYLTLKEFKKNQIKDILESILCGPITHESLQKLSETSAGNALVLHELVTHALRTGAFKSSEGIWQLNGPLIISDRLTEIFRHRLEAPYEQCTRVLELLSLCEPLPLETLVRFSSIEHVATLEKMGLIWVSPALGKEYSFVNPLHSEWVRSRVPESRRRAIYGAQAARLGSRNALNQADYLRVAEWKISASQPVDSNILAGAASAAFAAEEHNKVVSLLEVLDRSSLTFDLRYMLGMANHQLGNYSEAEILLQLAQESAIKDEQLLAIALERASNPVWNCTKLMNEFKIVKGKIDCENCTQHAEALLDSICDPRVRRRAEKRISYTSTLTGQVARGLRLSRILEPELSKKCRHLESPVYGMLALIENGQIDLARQIGIEAFGHAVEKRNRTNQIEISCHLGICDLIAGHLISSLRWFKESLVLAKSANHQPALLLAQAGRAAVAAQIGDSAQARTAMASVVSLLRARGRERWTSRRIVCNGLVGDNSTVQLFCALSGSWVAASSGDLCGARGRLERAAQRAGRVGNRAFQSWLLCDLTRLGPVRGVEQKLSEVSAAGDSKLAMVRTSVAIAMASSNASNLAASARLCANVGMHQLAMEVASSAAMYYSRSSNWPQVEKMQLFMNSMQGICGGVAQTPQLIASPTYPLTNREREIANMAARGMSNAKIASNLTLSTRTVDNHLYRIYSKLRISSRRDLVRVIF